MKKKINLEDLERKDIFSAPEGYHDKLADRIQKRIAEQKLESKRPVYQLASKKVYYVAASVAVLFIAAIIMLRTPEETSAPQNILAEVSTDAMIEYLEMSDVGVTEISLAEDEQSELLEDQWQNLTIPEEYTDEIAIEELEEFL